MTEPGTKLIVDAIAWMVAIGVFINVTFFLANLKLYIEIMKEKSQRKRQEERRDG